MNNVVGVIFPGQGSQYVGMGKALAQRYPAAHQTFEEASDVLGWDIQRLCGNGDLASLTETANAQPAILTHSVAAYRLLMEEGLCSPSIGGGHSLGEFSALTCSGVIAFADAVRLVRRRGEFMQAAARLESGGMAAVSGIPEEQLEKLLLQASEPDSIVVLAGINSPNQRVVSGHHAALLRLEKLLSGLTIRFTPLNVGAAFHSPCMNEAAELLREELEACVFHAPKWPVLSNVTGKVHDGESSSLIRLLTLQLTEPVRWLDCMEAMQSAGVTQVVEAGPGTVLTRLWKSFAPSIEVWSADNIQELDKHLGKQLSEPESQQPLSDKGLAAFLPRCLGIAAGTRNHNTDPEGYRIGVLEPYREVEAIASELRASGSIPTVEQLRTGWNMLQSMFQAKGTEPEEREIRLSRLMSETGTSPYFANSESNKGGEAL